MTNYEPKTLTLPDAASEIQKRLGCDVEEARKQLIAALRDDAVHAEGFVKSHDEWHHCALTVAYWADPFVSWDGSMVSSNFAKRDSQDAIKVRVSRESLYRTFPVDRSLASSHRDEMECTKWIE